MKQRNETTSGEHSVKRARTNGGQVSSGDAGVVFDVERQDFSRDEQHRLIAEAAYYHALKRGFAPGCEMDDWLKAEAEIGQIPRKPNTSLR